MRTLPTIIGLDRADTFWSRITRPRLLVAGFIILGLLSFSLLVTVIVQATNRGKDNNNNNNNNNNDNTIGTSTTSTTTAASTTTHTSAVIPTTTTTANNNNNTDEYCLDSGCISAATQQLRFMDNTASANRCTDFYKYACGGWQRTHPIQSFDVDRTILGDIINRRDGDIERLLNSPISRSTPISWEWKLKTYYSICRDDYGRMPDSGKYIISLIRDRDTVDGWFVLDNSGADSQEFLLTNQSVYTQISRIHGKLGVTAVFGIRTRFDETNPNVKRLEFFPAGLSMEINDYLATDTISEKRRSAYQIYIIEVLSLLAQEAGVNDDNLNNRTLTVANDVFTIEKFLAESLQRNPTDNKPRALTLAEMSAELSFNFTDLMSDELGDSNAVSELTSVYLTNVLYFTDAFELLGDEEDPIIARRIHNYLRWRLMVTYIDDLSYNYVHAHRTFLDAYIGHALHSTNEAYCTREVIRRFPLAIQRLYTMNSKTNVNTITTIQTIFNSLKNGFKEYINNDAAWMADEATKNIAREKIDALTAAIGYAPIASDDTSLDLYYEKWNVDESGHFQNAFGYHRFHKWSLSASLLNPNLLDHWDLFETRTDRIFDYIAIFNRLFVIASGMHEPIVKSEWPWPMNLGSIGVLLAQKLFASIDSPDGRTYLANGTRFDWWALQTITGYNNSRNCITDYYVNDLKTVTYNINGVPIQVPLAGEPFSPTTLRHIGALRFAYNTLMKNDEMKSFKMPGTNFTSEQTFFLAYAQTQCYQRDGLLQFIRTQLGFYDEQTALNAALMHMPEFAKVFQCNAKENQCF